MVIRVAIAFEARRPFSLSKESKVDVFYTTVPSSVEVINNLREILDQEERNRASRFVFDRDRYLFITAHSLLRYALCRATSIFDWRFCVSGFGKPELEAPFGHPPLRFNLSHSGSLTACAISFGWDVGIDLESVERDFDIDDVVDTYLTSSERAQLAAREGISRVDAFFRLWTLKGGNY